MRGQVVRGLWIAVAGAVVASGVAAGAVVMSPGADQAAGAGAPLRPAAGGHRNAAHLGAAVSRATTVARSSKLGGTVRWGTGAGRPSGPQAVSSHQAGYVASGKQFRYAQAVIVIPSAGCAGLVSQPRLYVALTGTKAAAVRAGLLCGPVPGPAGEHGRALAPARRWQGFIQVSGPALRSPVFAAFPLTGAKPGEGVFASVAAGAAAGTARAVLVLPGGRQYQQDARTGDAVYSQAQALADWGDGTPSTAARPRPPTLLTRFLSGEFVCGLQGRGVFAGPWTAKGNLWPRHWSLTADVVTTGGRRAASGTVLAGPSRLWTDGTQSVYGSRGDAFGIWLYR